MSWRDIGPYPGPGHPSLTHVSDRVLCDQHRGYTVFVTGVAVFRCVISFQPVATCNQCALWHSYDADAASAAQWVSTAVDLGLRRLFV